MDVMGECQNIMYYCYVDVLSDLFYLILYRDVVYRSYEPRNNVYNMCLLHWGMLSQFTNGYTGLFNCIFAIL